MTRRQGSATEAIGLAIEHVKVVLFRPFDMGRWLTLGFIAFLAYLGDGGYTFNLRGNPFGNEEENTVLRNGVTWMLENRLVTGIILFILFVIILALVVLVQWLSSRGTFMYIDCLATNRAEVVRPWKEHREIADSFFFWRLIFGLCVGFVSLLLVLPLLISFITALASGDEMDPFRIIFGSAMVFLTIPLLMVIVLFGALVRLILRDFVAPVQYMRRIRCGQAFRIVMGMIGANLGAFIVFILLKIAIFIIVTLCLIVIGCATCCIGFCCMAIPVIGQTVLQPLFVFLRSFSLFFLQGFGPEFDVFGPAAPGGGLRGPQPPQPPPPPPGGASTPWPSGPGTYTPGQSGAPPSPRYEPPPAPPESVPVSTWPEAPPVAPPAEPPVAPPAQPPYVPPLGPPPAQQPPAPTWPTQTPPSPTWPVQQPPATPQPSPSDEPKEPPAEPSAEPPPFDPDKGGGPR